MSFFSICGNIFLILIVTQFTWHSSYLYLTLNVCVYVCVSIYFFIGPSIYVSLSSALHFTIFSVQLNFIYCMEGWLSSRLFSTPVSTTSSSQINVHILKQSVGIPKLCSLTDHIIIHLNYK